MQDTGKNICVVGAGPAGLTAAYYLRKQGHNVTVKEALPKAGGMLQYGIPSYRMPREELDQEIAYILESGIKLETGVRVQNVTELKAQYDAVLVAIGNHEGTLLPMEGNDAEGILLNIDFLRNASMGNETGIGKRVIVLGGGNVAFDCARTAKRLGSEEIHVACLEARDKMTADEEEIEQAQEEGIQVHPAQSFEKILKGNDNKVTGVAFSDILSFTFDENRRAIIEKAEDSYHEIEADTVIFAVGQRCGLSPEAGMERGRANSIKANEKTLETDVQGVFACGDVTYGTKSVILAIADGRKVAEYIDKYLGGDGDISEVLAPVEEHPTAIGQVDRFGYESRRKSQILSAKERKDNFKMVDAGICDADICGEASRCLQCDLRMDITRSKIWSDYDGEEGGENMLKYIENKEAEEKIAEMNAEQILDKIVEIKDPVTNTTVGEMISNLKATARNEKMNVVVSLANGDIDQMLACLYRNMHREFCTEQKHLSRFSERKNRVNSSGIFKRTGSRKEF